MMKRVGPMIRIMIGLSIFLLGAYVAGGGDVTCTRVGGPTKQAEAAEPVATGPVIASCRARTTRWLGQHIVADQTYARVTDFRYISGRNSGTLQLIADGTVIDGIAGTHAQAGQASGRLMEWFKGDARDPVELDFSEWPFAYAAMGFGTLWLALCLTAARTRASTTGAP